MYTPYIAALMAGNVILASDRSLAPAPGTFLTDVIVFKIDAHPAPLGQPLQIFVKTTAVGQVDIDAVPLTVE